MEMDIKTLESQLRQSQKMEALGTLAGGIAHDFNNLLTTITGYAQLMLYDKSEDDPDCEKLKNIIRSVERGSELTSQLLSLSRKIEVVQTPMDLNTNILEVKKLLDSTISKMIEIEIQVAETPQIIDGDPGQIEQVIMNLAINAKDAMAEGGKIIISTKPIDTPKQFIKRDMIYSHTSTYPKKGSYVLLTVSDTGSGITEEKLDFVFDPFFTTKEIGKGTGLGLAMVYEIIKNHSGYIICYSELDIGTIFEIYFPSSNSDYKIKRERKRIKIEGGNETILVVDDELDVREMTELALKKEGYNVISCFNAEEALKAYKNNKISLVLLDIIMPGMGGIRCLEELIKLNPKIKIIMTSGFSGNQSKKVIHLGAKQFIPKPFNIIDMLIEIRKVLDQHNG
jgi:nitrogen-specific signal transduction histidine kinase/CheY-like chemotaxis protein